jgi:hypothetical protein
MQTESAAAFRVQFTLNADDWRTVLAEQRRNGAFPRLLRAYTILFLGIAVVAIGATAYALLAPVVFPTLPHRRVPWLSLLPTFLTGGIMLLNQLVMRRSLLPPLQVGATLDVRFADAGISLGERPARCIPWRWIAGARDIDEAIVLSDVQSNVLVLPKRLFPDRGAALWSFLEHRLISRRGLIRRPDARRTIFNTMTTS